MKSASPSDDIQTITPRLLILIPVSNEEKYIERCLNSVRKQDFISWKIILRDNASTDSTLEIARKLAEGDSRINIESSSIKSSAADNWNKITDCLMSNEKIDYVMWLAGDDYLFEHNYISNCIRISESSSEIDVVTPVFMNCDEQGSIDLNHKFISKMTSGTKFMKSRSLGTNWGNAATIYGIYKRNTFVKLVSEKTSRISDAAESDWWWAFSIATQFRLTNCLTSTYIKTIKTSPYYLESRGYSHETFLSPIVRVFQKGVRISPLMLLRQVVFDNRVTRHNFVYALVAITSHSHTYLIAKLRKLRKSAL